MNLDIQEPQSSTMTAIQSTFAGTANHQRFFLQDAGATAKTLMFPFLSSSSRNRSDLIVTLVNAYVSGGVSIARAAEIIGLCYEDFIRKVVDKGLKLPMGPATLEEFREEERTLRLHLRRSG